VDGGGVFHKIFIVFALSIYMQNPKIVVCMIIAVILVVAIAIFSYVSLDNTIEENENSVPQSINQSKAEQLVLSLNLSERAEIFNSTLENNTWIISIKDYQDQEDQLGYFLIYRVDALTSEIN